ncbi:MAG: energy transducer TonB, partial [Terriglobia bacterium]
RPACNPDDKKDLVQPRPLFEPAAPYPDAARNEKREGQVLLYADAGTDGHLRGLFIIDSPGLDFDASVLKTVSTWRMRPATCKGVPVEAETLIRVSFRAW